MSDNKKVNQQQTGAQNVLESLKGLGSGTVSQSKDLLKNTSEDFLRELLGFSRSNVKKSGEIGAGETIDIKDVFSGKEEENQKAKKQIKFERYLLNEEKRTFEEKDQALRMELQAIMQELKSVAESTENLAEATEVAMISAPVEPGIYHINFFQNILEFLKSFKKKIDLAATWLTSANKRAEKKNYWATFKKHGSSFLLAPDHYSQRSAG